jgi:hypothetical protein
VLRAGLQHRWLTSLLLALTAHLGKWETIAGKKRPVWVVLGDFLYAQVIKHQLRRRTVEVEMRMIWGEKQ